MYYHKRYPTARRGFTIVELILCVVIIGLLAGITTVAYSGIQKRAASAAMQSDLENAASIVEQYGLRNDGSFPDSAYLRAQFKGTKTVSLTVSSSGTAQSSYIGLSDAQNATLFVNLCNEMMPLTSGSYIYTTTCMGQWGMNLGGGSHGGYVATPIQSTFTLVDSACTNPSSNAGYCLPYHTVATEKTDALRELFLAQGGTFPITMQNNTPAMLPPLPAAPSAPNSYCIAATHTGYPELHYRINSEKLKPELGACE